MIDEKAFVHPQAKLGKDVKIGPWSYIDKDVEIGDGCIIEPHAVIKAHVSIGKNNHIYQFASIGEAPQHTGYKGEPTRLEIGDNNLIREYASINRGTEEGGGVTKVGDNNFIMSYAHIAHDCRVGNNIVFANSAQIAGHVTVDDHVILGGFVGVHQFCHIGAYSFLGRAAKIVKDILPFMIVSGNPGAPTAVNSVGLRRQKFSREDIKAIKDAFKFIYRQGNSQQQIIEYLNNEIKNTAVLQQILTVIENSERGIAYPGSEDS
jgi:UDP-N-acetylglucosamine acyltransferase